MKKLILWIIFAILMFSFIGCSASLPEKPSYVGIIESAEYLDKGFFEYNEWELTFKGGVKIIVRYSASDIIEIGKEYNVYKGGKGLLIADYYYIKRAE